MHLLVSAHGTSFSVILRKTSRLIADYIKAMAVFF
jgi:hypothetical protein